MIVYNILRLSAISVGKKLDVILFFRLFFNTFFTFYLIESIIIIRNFAAQIKANEH